MRLIKSGTTLSNLDLLHETFFCLNGSVSGNQIFFSSGTFLLTCPIMYYNKISRLTSFSKSEHFFCNFPRSARILSCAFRSSFKHDVMCFIFMPKSLSESNKCYVSDIELWMDVGNFFEIGDKKVKICLNLNCHHQ